MGILRQPFCPATLPELDHLGQLGQQAYEKIHEMRNPLPYRPDIDGLRAIAVISVIAYHLQSTFLPGGFIGVDIFFVISGFVVSAALSKANASSFLGFIAQFYARRLARIVPTLVLVLSVSALLASLFIPRAWLSSLSEETALYAFWGISNWRLQTNTDVYFSPRAEFNPYTQTWSLGVEEQFYLIAPMLFFLWAYAQQFQRPSLARLSTIALSILALGSLIFCAWASTHYPAVAFYSIGARFWELALGALLFFISVKTSPTLAGNTKLIGSIGLIGIGQKVLPWLGLGLITAAALFAMPTAFPWPWALAPAIGALCIIGGVGAEQDHPLRAFLSRPFWVWIGKRSYSLYLWHWPVFVLLRWTTGLETVLQYGCALAITVLLSMLSYRYVEQIFRHNAWIEKHSNRFIIILFLAMPLSGMLLSQYLFTHLQQFSWSTVSRAPNDWYGSNLTMYVDSEKRPCQVDQSFIPFAGGTQRVLMPSQCQIPPHQPTIYVLGDSHAGAIIPMLEQISAQTGTIVKVFSFQGTVATPYACSYLDLQAPMEVGRAPGCLEFNTATRDLIASQAKPGDLVLLSSLRMMRYGDQWASFQISDMQERMDSEKVQALRKDAAAQIDLWIKPFLAQQMKVIFVAPTPIFRAPTFRCADWFNAHNPICVGNNQQPRADLEKLRAPILSAMQQQAQKHANVLIWDTLPILCKEESCSALSDGKPLFFDGDHFSNYGNWVLYPHFKDWLAAQALVNSSAQK